MKISFSWEILDKFDKYGTLFLILLFNKSILLPVCVCKIAGWVANSVNLIRCCVLRRLVWVYTVCSGVSARIHRVSTVI